MIVTDIFLESINLLTLLIAYTPDSIHAILYQVAILHLFRYGINFGFCCETKLTLIKLYTKTKQLETLHETQKPAKRQLIQTNQLNYFYKFGYNNKML